MDLDRLARRVSEQLAAQPSRRGILAKVAKLALGGGALLAGLQRYEEAAGRSLGNTCCTGNRACTGKTDGICPRNSRAGWFWTCQDSSGNCYTCQDCMNQKDGLHCVAPILTQCSS